MSRINRDLELGTRYIDLTGHMPIMMGDDSSGWFASSKAVSSYYRVSYEEIQRMRQESLKPRQVTSRFNCSRFNSRYIDN